MVKKCLAGILAAVLTMTSLTTYPQAAIRSQVASSVAEEVILSDDAVETVIEEETVEEETALEETVVAENVDTVSEIAEDNEESAIEEEIMSEALGQSEDIIAEEYAVDVKKYHETEIRPSETVINPATPLPTGNEALSTATGTITVNEAAGYAEGMYVEWAKVADVDGYVGSYKKQGASVYTDLDDELIRYYPEYVRADAVGLSAGTYEFKIDAKKNDAVVATTTVTCEVTPDDRSGYCFTNGHNPGAYKADGTLKEGAVVVYVNDANFTTVKVTVGSQTYVGIQDLVDDGRWKTVTKPVDIRIIGTIDGAKFPTGYLSSTEEGLQAKSDAKGTSQPLTIEGIGEDAAIKNFGILFRGMNDVEVKNFAVMMCLDDSISINTSNRYFWVHNMDLFYGRPGSAADQKKGDGTLDLKDNSQYQTYAYNHFWDSGKCSLCGMKSESGPNYITYHHNWFDHSDSRHPRIRTMSVHVYNNYFDGNSKYGTGLAKDSNAFIESNFYRNCKYPILSAGQGNDIYAGTADGTHKTTFSGETGGIAKAYRNIIAGECTYAPYGEDTFVKKGTVTNKLFDQKIQFDAYEVSSRTETIPSSVTSFSGGNSYNGFDTSTDLGVKESAIDAPEDIPAIVTAKAGRLNGGDFAYNDATAGLVKHIPPYSYVGKDSSGNPYTFTQDTDYAVIDELSNQLKAYKSSLVAIGGMANAPLVQMRTVTLNPDNGDASTEVKYPVNSQMSEPAAPAKTPAGKAFAGWYIDDKKVTFPYTVAADVTMTAKWLTQYTVTFDSDGGSVVDTQKVFDGAKAVRPADPEKDGYSFKGWMNGSTLYDFSSVVTGSLSLKASWISEADVIKVTFYNGSNVFTTRNVEKGTTVETVSGERKGYDFNGWFKDADCTQTFDFATPITVATAVYGKWTKKAGEKAIYTLYWGVKDGESTTSISGIQSKPGYFSVATGFKSATFNVNYNDKVYTKALKFDSTGKIEFTTVNPNAKLIVVTDTASKRVNVDGTNVAGDASGVVTTTLVGAGYHKIIKGDSINVVYVEVQDGEINESARTINFHYDYGTGTKTITTEDDTKTLAENIEAAKSAGKYEEPSFYGMKTAGWFSDAACTEKVADTTVITDNIDLYTYFVGSHDERVYRVQFFANGGELEGDSTVYVEKGQLVTEPIIGHDEYFLEGWYTDADFTSKWDFANNRVNGELKLFCNWIEDPNVEIFVVEFDLNGHGSYILPKEVASGKKLESIITPKAKGWKFKGWTLNGEAFDLNTAITGNITLKATWEEAVNPGVVTPDIFEGMEAGKVYGEGEILQFKSRLGFDIKTARDDNPLEAGGTVATPAGIQSHSETVGTTKIEKDGLIIYASEAAKLHIEIFAYSSKAQGKKLYFVDLGNSSITDDGDLPERAKAPANAKSTDDVAANVAFKKDFELEAGHKYFITLGTGGNIMFSGISYEMIEEPDPETYTVTFETNGHGTAPAAILNVLKGSRIAVSEPSAKGFKFIGWYKDKDCTAEAKWNFATDVVNDNVTLYAKWVENDDPEDPPVDEGLITVPSMEEIAAEDYYYTGAAVKPAFTCYYQGAPLVEGVDYTVVYKNNVNVYTEEKIDVKKTPYIQIKGKGNFAGIADLIYFKIKPITLDAPKTSESLPEVTLNAAKYKIVFTDNKLAKYDTLYTGSEIKLDDIIKVTSKDGSDVLDQDDYKLIYADNIKAGKATVYAIANNAKHKYSGYDCLFTGKPSDKKSFIKANFTIKKVDFVKTVDEDNDPVVEVASDYDGGYGDVKYNASKKTTPQLMKEGALVLGDYKLVEGKDFTVSYKNNNKITEDSMAANKLPAIVLTGKGSFSGKIEIPFTISRLDLSDKNDVKIYVPNVLDNAKVSAVKPLVFDSFGNIVNASEYQTVCMDEGGKELAKTALVEKGMKVVVKPNGKATCIFEADKDSEEIDLGIGKKGTFKAELAKYKAPSNPTVTQKKNNGKKCYELSGKNQYTGTAVYLDKENDAGCGYIDEEAEGKPEYSFLNISFKAGTETYELDKENGYQADDFDYVYANNVKAGTATVYIIPKVLTGEENSEAKTATGYKKFTYKITGKNWIWD